jgi:hypothetical protein
MVTRPLATGFAEKGAWRASRPTGRNSGATGKIQFTALLKRYFDRWHADASLPRCEWKNIGGRSRSRRAVKHAGVSDGQEIKAADKSLGKQTP